MLHINRQIRDIKSIIDNNKDGKNRNRMSKLMENKI